MLHINADICACILRTNKHNPNLYTHPHQVALIIELAHNGRTHTLTHPPTHSLTHPPTHPLTHPPTHSLTQLPASVSLRARLQDRIRRDEQLVDTMATGETADKAHAAMVRLKKVKYHRHQQQKQNAVDTIIRNVFISAKCRR